MGPLPPIQDTRTFRGRSPALLRAAKDLPVSDIVNNGAARNLRNHRVVNSDFRRSDWAPEARQTQSFPIPKQNGHLVASENAAPERMTYYTTDAYGGKLRAENPPTRRQRSLPSRRPIGDGRSRQANSAPSRKDRPGGNNGGGAPLPRINNLIARSRGPTAGDQSTHSHVPVTAFAGVSTKNQDFYHRSNKFASTWAQVRAENHIDVGASSEHPKQSPRDSSQDGDRSRERSRNKSVSPHRNTSTSPHRNQNEASPDRKGRGENRSVFHAKTQDKENVKPSDNSKETKKEITANRDKSPPKSNKEEKKEKYEIRFAIPDPNHDHESSNGDTDIASYDYNEDQREEEPTKKSTHPRPTWDNRLTLKPPELNLKVKSMRRYEAELTHKPNVTSTDQVYKAYTGRTKRQVKEEEVDRRDVSPESVGRGRPQTKDSHSTENNSRNSEQAGQGKKEYVLTRNEAKMYIHLQGVYGSDSFRHQRKERFFKKLTDLQEQEEKQQEEERKKAQQRREESKRRQQRQLMYVRRKFRRQQLHRFRTQYVTSRVLEYERDDRDMYGLPGDSESESDSESQGSPHVSETNHNSRTSDQDTKSPEQNSKTPGQTTKNEGYKEEEQKTESSSEPQGLSPAKTQDTKVSGSKDEQNVKTEKGTPNNISKSKPSDKSNTSGKDTAVSKGQKEPNGAQTGNEGTGKETEKSDTHKGVDPVNSTNKETSCKTTSKLSDPRSSKQDKNKNTQKVSDKDDSKTVDGKTSVNTQNKQTVSSPDKGPDAKQHQAKHDTKNSVSNDVGKSVSTDGAKAQDKTTSKDSSSKTPSKSVDKTEANTQQTSPARQTATTTKNSSPSTMNSKGTVVNGHSTTEAPSSQGKADKDSKPTTSIRPDDKQKPGSKAVSDPNTSKAQKEDAGKDASTGKKGNAQDDSYSKMNGHSTEPSGHSTEEENKRQESKPADVDKTGRQREKDTEQPNRKTAVTKDSKGRYITTTKVFGSDAPARKTTVANGTSKSGDRRQSSQDRQATDKPAHPSQNRTRSESRGGKRKPAHAHPLTEAEQKKEMERKFGKLFDVSTGPTWDKGSKPPKMEGIDTVLLKETDSKGRTRTKKRDVKDVVSEAKKAVAAPTDPDSPRNEDSKKGQKSQTRTNRPPSADTLDFEDDDDEDEDVFEKLRKKYNLQIDSDED